MLKDLARYGFGVAIVQLLVACGAATQDEPMDMAAEASAETVEATVTEPAEAETLIVAFGDSLYAGYGLDQTEGFAPELEQSLKARNIDVRVHNAGVSGDTTAAGLRRLSFVLDSLSQKPDLVILGLGGNDMLRGLQPDETRANMEAMVKQLGEREIPVMLTGMLAAPNLGKEYSDQFNVIFPALARKYDTALYPFFMNGVVGNPDLMLPDGIHPNAEGIDLIVEQITPSVVDALSG